MEAGADAAAPAEPARANGTARSRRKGRPAGLRIERRFTEPGQDVWASVPWEERSAVITGERGEVVFEQHDIAAPATWTQLALNVVASKYFRGHIGTPERETSVRQLIERVAYTIASWGRTDGYFASDADFLAFRDELTHLLLHQKGSFNSPVWFNVGLAGQPNPQCSACFINSVEDTMDSILTLARTEGMLFKFGSGTGTNFSTLRSSREHLQGGGTASGPVSFMRGYDAFAGVIKSGGKTRRAAKMVILNVDHPDIRHFITCKADEERKAWTLIDAGYNGNFNVPGGAYDSVSYQNANHSVRVTDDFMQACVTGGEWSTRNVIDGTTAEVLAARDLMRLMAESAWVCGDPGMQYDTTINRWHTCKATDRIHASNPCSEYMFLDDSACNLASLNLMRFRRADCEFDVEAFRHACRIFITAQEIIVGNASYPTERIARNSQDYRPLGLGYANLGALLMSRGVPYDSDAGRALAAVITAVMTGEAYHQSAIIARDQGGPFAGYAPNREPFLDVMRMHRGAVETIDASLVPPELIDAARGSWEQAIEVGEGHGYRNAQASVLAPTGCLVADSLILTDRGLMRLSLLGDPRGDRWQDAAFRVLTDEGEQDATRFFINGVEPTRRIVTRRGYTIQGTHNHRVKVVDSTTGEWRWKRFADIEAGDVVPLSMGQLAGSPRAVALPPIGEAGRTGDPAPRVPRQVTPDLAELVGYFEGDGAPLSKGPRFRVANPDPDVVDRMVGLLGSLFSLDARTVEYPGHREVIAHSAPLAHWWDACGFSAAAAEPDHPGARRGPRVPDAILATNDPAVYGAFLRGLYGAGGAVEGGAPCWTTPHRAFAEEVQALLLALGVPTATRLERSEWSQSDLYVLRPCDAAAVAAFTAAVGPIGASRARSADGPNAPRERQDELAGHAPRFLYDTVAANEDGGEQMTYDLSVPGNVTYIAGGFISHNTIGFMMDCDTTGIEPDIAIVKYKSLVGGGMMKIVNNTVPEALARLGYDAAQARAIVDYIDAHDTIEGAPGVRAEDLPVFDCAFKPSRGTRSIHYMGHVKMMAAVQPFLSGAISKTVNMPHDATPDEIVSVFVEGWRLGLKAIAIYRDGSKRTQPLMTRRSDDEPARATAIASGSAGARDEREGASAPAVTGVSSPYRPVRHKLPDERRAITHKFSVAGHEGYITVGMYEDGAPGEIFLTMSKEGSTISGLMDTIATMTSLALQYGVPLETLVGKFAHMRFEPSGITPNPDIRFAKSIPDYIFRWLGIKYLPSVAQPPTEEVSLNGILEAGAEAAPPTAEPAPARPNYAAREREIFELQADAPTCADCGALMVRNGACYKCLNCGSVLGCS
ncbi:MAG: vitamin B12-dependent ribonucleotide reductase [Chthonomonadales bacterium]|nr:vitamin B12-dependent ribonucleotide reductase [Chthonomonadales bacterium]